MNPELSTYLFCLIPSAIIIAYLGLRRLARKNNNNNPSLPSSNSGEFGPMVTYTLSLPGCRYLGSNVDYPNKKVH